MARNMKNKYTPEILAHVAVYNLRRNNLNDALKQIDRALELKKEIEKEVVQSQSIINLLIKKAFIQAKLRQHKECEESIIAA